MGDQWRLQCDCLFSCTTLGAGKEEATRVEDNIYPWYDNYCMCVCVHVY